MFVVSFGHFHPENLIDNPFLESLDIGIDDSWVVARTGIRTRHTVLPLDYIRTTRNHDPRAADEAALFANADTGALAASMALRKAGLSGSDIGLVIAGGCAPSMKTPPDACLIAERLGITAPAFDLNSACSSFVAQLHHLSSMKPEALPDFILLVIADNLTRAVDYSDRADAVLMGDASVAAILSPRVPSAIRVRSTTLNSDPANWRRVSLPAYGHMSQKASAVQNFAIRKMSAVVDQLRPATNPFWFIGHQANLPMLQSVCRRAGVQEERHLFNIDTRGDCGGAGGPSVLSEQFHRFLPGDEILLALVGAGLTWGGALLSFQGMSGV